MAGNHEVKPLPYAYDALDGISEQVNRWHHDIHYAGYVNKRNEVETQLQEADRSAAHANFSLYGELKRRETFNANGQILHEIYWNVLGGSGGEATGKVGEKIQGDFGSFEAWKEDFIASAKVALGWAVLAFDLVDGKLHNFTGDTHNQGGVWGAIPLIPIDVFEHAYYHDQGPDRGKYINAFLQNINWDSVNDRFERFVPQL